MRRGVAYAILAALTGTVVGFAPQFAAAAMLSIVDNEPNPVTFTTTLAGFTGVLGDVINPVATAEGLGFSGILFSGNSTVFATPGAETIQLLETGDTVSDTLFINVGPITVCNIPGGGPCQLLDVHFTSDTGEASLGTPSPPSTLETGLAQDVTSLFTLFPAGSLTVTIQSDLEQPVPEPGTATLLALGSLAVAAVRRWRRS